MTSIALVAERPEHSHHADDDLMLRSQSHLGKSDTESAVHHVVIEAKVHTHPCLQRLTRIDKGNKVHACIDCCSVGRQCDTHAHCCCRKGKMIIVHDMGKMVPSTAQQNTTGSLQKNKCTSRVPILR